MMKKSETASQNTDDGDPEEILLCTFIKCWRIAINSILEEDLQSSTQALIKVIKS